MAGQHPGAEKRMKENSFHETRQRRAQKMMDSNHLDGVLFTSLENIRYLCGFSGSDGALVLTQRQAFFLTDSRYWTQSEEEVKAARIVHYRRKLEGICSLLSDLGIRRIGFESVALTFSLHRSLSARLTGQSEFIALEEELKNLRAIKDVEEMASIKAAIEIASEGFEYIMERMKEGVVEREIAFEMECFMKSHGSESMGFDTIIASGKRAALPHGKASSKPIERGDLILIDFGSMSQGYYSDETRTVVCGHPSAEQRRVYQIVKDAHDRAIEAVRPGVPIHEVDAAARDYIREQGYGEYFGHGTGHGIGLAVHEDPAVNADNKGPAEEGMVFTVEPGIYIPDWGGVRIEDMVRVTAQGAELLTHLPTDLRVL